MSRFYFYSDLLSVVMYLLKSTDMHFIFPGAFLIPYILMVFIIGLPIFFAELFLGQYTGVGPNQAFHRIAPIFQGIVASVTQAKLFIN